MSDFGREDGGIGGSSAERITLGEGITEPFGISPRFIKFLLAIFCIGLVGVSVFQSTDNYYAHRRQDRQGRIIANQNATINDLSTRLKSDDEFFAAVRQLIIIGPNADAAQRQAIVDELKREDAARSAATTTTTVKPGKVSGGSTIPPKSRTSSTVPPSQTTTTTMKPSSPPSSTPVPPSSLPLPPVCVGSTCITVPPITVPKQQVSSGVDQWIFNLFLFVRDVGMR